MNIRVEWNPDTLKKFKNLTTKGQSLLDSEVLKSSNMYVPVDSHELERSGVSFTQFGSGQIIWNTPYAAKLYHNPQYTFSTDTNPRAQGKWFEAAKSSDLKSWIKMLDALKNGIF